MGNSEGTQWRRRPVLAVAVRCIAHGLPLALSIGTAWWVGGRLPRPGGLGEAVVTWLVLSVVASIVLLLVQRLTRRLLPLSTLLQLSLVFPDRAPARFKVARATATTRQLEDEVRAAREASADDDRTTAAERVLRLVAALSTHDRATRGHAERVRVFTDMVADEMGLSTDERDRLRWAALLHDVGKIAVHPKILNKPGRPSASEWETLRQHPLEGARLVAPLRSWLGDWGLTIEQHHEQWDGSGYPYGLAGSQISLGARIVAVADAFDVMTARRPYKEAMPATVAREELARCAGTQFDPAVVRAFLSVSLGRLRWVAGPISWFAHAPLARPVPSVAGNPQLVLGSAAALAGTALPSGHGLPSHDHAPEVPVALAVVTPGELDDGSDGAFAPDPGATRSPEDDGRTRPSPDADEDAPPAGDHDDPAPHDDGRGTPSDTPSGGTPPPPPAPTTPPPTTDDGPTTGPGDGDDSGDDVSVDLGDAGSVDLGVGLGDGPVPEPTVTADIDVLDGTVTGDVDVEVDLTPSELDDLVPDIGATVGADLPGDLPDVEVTVPDLPDLPGLPGLFGP